MSLNSVNFLSYIYKAFLIYLVSFYIYLRYLKTITITSFKITIFKILILRRNHKLLFFKNFSQYYLEKY